MATLTLLQQGEAVPYELDGDEMLLGRHPDCQIQLHSGRVSRRHARITRQEGGFYLEDLGSGNGSFVNGKQITEPTRLNDQDRVKLGPMLFRFDDDEAPTDAGVSLEATAGVDLDLSDEENDQATIVGSAESQGGFGMLDVRPEAKLKGVLEISRSLTGTVELETLLPRILETLFRLFPHADRGVILLGRSGDGQWSRRPRNIGGKSKTKPSKSAAPS